MKRVTRDIYKEYICRHVNRAVQVSSNLLLHVNFDNKAIARVIFKGKDTQYYIK